MPINNIPGVGPTNADIATAVAAPSAATIAAAVAAPSAATIAATVAAPSAATIATAVAGAVPTLGQINTSVSTNAPSPHTWTLISTVTPNSTATSVSFTGISGYKTLKIVCPRIETTGGTLNGIALRINSDATSGNYSGAGWSISPNNSISPTLNLDTWLVLSSGNGPSGGGFGGHVTIYNSNVASQKFIESFFVGAYAGASGGGFSQLQGVWTSTATITSLTIHNNGTALLGGGKSIYLYGAN